MYGVHHGYYNQYDMSQSYPAQFQMPQYTYYRITLMYQQLCNNVSSHAHE